MKKFLLSIIVILALSSTASAQFTYFGVQVSGGLTTLRDDLTDKTPLLGASVGVFTTLEFKRMTSVMSHIFYLEAGINIARRGGKYSETFAIADKMTSQHEGTFDALYAQIPILANFHFELPNRNKHQYVRFFVGPAVSVGFFGQYSECKVTPHQPQRVVNFKILKEPAFDYMNRLDAEIIFGLGYETPRWTVSFYVDHGFLSLKDEPDALRAIENNGDRATHAGVSCSSYMLSLAYRIPLQKGARTN